MTGNWFDDDKANGPAGHGRHHLGDSEFHLGGYDNSEDLDDWYVDDGPMVRPYTLTRGRTVGAGHDLDMLTVVALAKPAPRLRRSDPEYHEILRMCQTAQSIAEVAATLRRPLAVTKILIGDLISEGHLIFRDPVQQQSGQHDVRLLRAVLDGIRRL
ncbi:DUF742 domain-containing protein [Nocardia alni]|uniref:DUF742 domain-containing protein n=1 Tax=Nocardia alni TaxID=2815723 RepID=UPI001C243FED|nr:DUF742 domain-containing protein [Nocardia alni]